MVYKTPEDLFTAVVHSRNVGDVETYLGCYEENATIVTEPGTVTSGQDALRGFLKFFTNLQPTFTVVRRNFVKGSEITLHLSEWTLTGTDAGGNAIAWSGRTTDVLRKQTSGGWLVALDNPWGVTLLD